MKILAALFPLFLAGCASLNFGWYKPGNTPQEFAQDKFQCMSGSQMQVSTSTVQGSGPTYYENNNVTCNSFGSTTNCSGGGSYSQPGYVSGSSNTYTATNMPLFQACMQARGYVWTSQAEVDNYESGQRAQLESEASRRAHMQQEAEAEAQKAEQEAVDRAVTHPAKVAAAASSVAAAGISAERYAAARARCRAVAGDDPICDEITARDVLRSEAVLAAKR